MLLVEEECDSKIADLFFRIFGSGYQVDGLQMAEINLESIDVDVQQLPIHVRMTQVNSVPIVYLANIFLARIAIQLPVLHISADSTSDSRCSYL